MIYNQLMVIDATEFQEGDDTVIVACGERKIRCSTYILRKQSAYFREILALTFTNESEEIELLEKNTEVAIAFIVKLHDLRNIDPVEWNIDFADLASKWMVEAYISIYRAQLEAAIGKIRISSPLSVSNCFRSSTSMVYNRDSENVTPFQGVRMPCKYVRDLSAVKGWMVTNFAKPGELLPAKDFFFPYNGEVGIISRKPTRNGYNAYEIQFESNSTNVVGVSKLVSITLQNDQLPVGCYVVQPPVGKQISATKFWEMIPLLLNNAAYYLPELLQTKSDVVKLLRCRSDLIVPDLMISLFTQDEIAVIVSALN